MRNLHLGLLSLWFVLASSFPALSQNSTSSAPQVTASDAPAQSGITLAPAPASFNEVMDRVIEKEHLFVAQMRHMRPMVETYLQDLKSDSNGTTEPVKDQYFLGRLDMSAGPEDTSFGGAPGFGR